MGHPITRLWPYRCRLALTGCARALIVRPGFVAHVLVAAIFLLTFAISPAAAQTQDVPSGDPPIIVRGDAVVTGFSSVTALRPKPNGKLEDYIIIDTQAPPAPVTIIPEDQS